MARAIPVGDATEIPMDPVDGRAPKLRALPTPTSTEVPFSKPADLRGMGFDMGPGNPAVQTPGASAQAQAYNGLRLAPPNMGPQLPPTAAPVAAPPVPMQARISQGLRDVRGVGSNVLRAGAPALAGAAAGALGQALRTPEPTTPFVPPEAKPGDIPLDPGAGYVGVPAAAERQPLGFGGNSEFTRNAANTLNAMGGVGSMVGGLSRLFRSGSNVARAVGAGERAADVVRGAGVGAALTASPTAGAQPLAAPPASPPPQAPFSDARFESQNPGLRAPLTLPPGVTRTGNSYSDGSDPNGMTRVSAVPSLGYEGFRQMADNIRNLPGTGEAGGMTGIGRGATLREIADAQNLGPSFKDQSSGRGAREERMANARIASEQAIAGMRERGDMARAGMTTGATLRGQDINAALGREGHEVQREGQLMTARTARVQGMRDQFNKDREFGAAQQERDLKASQESQAALDKQLEARFRTTDEKGNDVADHGKIASYKAATLSTLPAMVQALRASQNPAAQAKADELEKRGVSALSPADHDTLQQLFDRRELARATKGAGPGATSFVDSNNLLDFMQHEQNGVGRGFAGRRVNLRNGTSIDIDKLTYGASGNTILPNWFTAPNTNQLRGLRGLE